MKKSIYRYLFLLLAATSLTAGAQSLKLDDDAAKADYIMTSKDTVEVGYDAGFGNVVLMTNIAGVTVTKESADADWVSYRKEANGNITFFSQDYYDNRDPRYATFVLSNADGTCTRKLVVKQLPNTSADEIGDKKIVIQSGTASSSQDGEGIERSFDGSTSTLWHSSYSGGNFPFTVTYTFQSASHVDYMIYVPRTGNINGCWGKITVSYATGAASGTWVKLGDYDCGSSNSPYTVQFGENGINDVKKVKIEIKSAASDNGGKFASCAEIGFYEKDSSLNRYISQLFTDELCTQLKPGVDLAAVQKVRNAYIQQLAMHLLEGGYSTEFRVGEFGCYLDRNTLRNQLKTSSPYDMYENPTGIYFEAGEKIVVFAKGIDNDYPVQICIKNFSNASDVKSEGQPESYYVLSNGANVITASNRGNAYVSYYSDDYANAPRVKLHFALATESGYFDAARHTNADWTRILAQSKSDNIDFLTQRLHVVVPKANLRNVGLKDAEKLVKIYDAVIYREREIMGLQQFDREPANHQFARPVESGMFADGIGAAAAFGSFNEWCNPDNFGFWGIAHELGHVNQIQPGFKWPGCGETTNNIYASWVEHKVGAKDAYGTGYHRLEDENSGIDSYSGTRGGKFEAYLEEGVRKGVAWQLQDGPDYHGAKPDEVTVMGQDADGKSTGTVTTTKRNYCHFTKVVPLWQLTLWTEECGKAVGAWGRLIESYRTDFSATAYNTSGKQQIEMMKRYCDAAKVNLLPFFEKAGLLKPINAYIEDYSKGWLIINETMINGLKSYVQGKGYPEAPAGLNFINAYNYPIFRDTTPLAAKAVGTGCVKSSGTRVRVDNQVWTGAVGYETYDASGTLLHLSMFGLGDSQMSSRYTYVLFPSNASYIMAVGYDGKKVKVYEK